MREREDRQTDRERERSRDKGACFFQNILPLHIACSIGLNFLVANRLQRAYTFLLFYMLNSSVVNRIWKTKEWLDIMFSIVWHPWLIIGYTNKNKLWQIFMNAWIIRQTTTTTNEPTGTASKQPQPIYHSSINHLFLSFLAPLNFFSLFFSCDIWM